MWVDLADNGEIDIEMEIEGLEWNVCPQATIFPLSDRISYDLNPDIYMHLTWYSRRESRTLRPKEYGVREPSSVFIMSTTGFRMPGTAALANTADQITQSGDVK